MEKNCKNCTYFPCLKPQCLIGNKEGCNDFKSISQTIIEETGGEEK